MGAVFQVDGHSAHRLSAYVQLRKDGQPSADALLAVEVPVILLGQADHTGAADGPAGENSVAMEALGVFIIHQLDEFKAPGVVQTKRLCQFTGGVLVAGAGAAVIQLVGQDHVKGLNIRAIPQKFLNFRQVHAPFHVEHQDAQGLRDLCGRRDKVISLRLGKLGDHGHDLRLRPVI